MTRDVGVGLSFQPDDLFLDLLDDAFHHDVDFVEVAPETLWRKTPAGDFAANGFHARLCRLLDETGAACVAHGVGLSLGSASLDEARWRRWMQRIAADQTRLHFRWYTDHLGASALDGHELALPLPILPSDRTAARVRSRLRALQAIVPEVGVENAVHYFMPNDALDEAAFLRDLLAAQQGMHLVLDVHNLHTMAQNFGFEPEGYLARLDLERVIELHVSGGCDSDPSWLPDGAALRLDSHDAAVPETVWTLLEHVAPRCPRVRGITLERMEGTVDARAVPALRDELKRLREFTRGLS